MTTPGRLLRSQPFSRSVLLGSLLAGAFALSGCGVFGGDAASKDQAAADVTPEGMVGTATAKPEVKAFTVEVRAPDAVRDLLQKHLELNRYRAVTDLSESEMTRLLVLAERDARNLVATQGYFSPTVRVSKNGDMGQQPTVVVEVELGSRTNIAKVDIDLRGDIETTLNKGAIEQRQQLRKSWKLKEGEVFTQDAWAASKQDALRALVARRYPAAKIADSEAKIDAPNHTADLGFELDSGPLYRYGPMQVTGIERYDPVIVPRVARLKPGQEYDQKDIDDAQKRLAGTGYFDSAFIFVDPAGDPDAVPVQVTVKEAPRKKVVFGVGFTTDGGPHASIEYADQRVPGIGWRSVNKLQIDTRNPFAETAWTSIPDEDGWRWGALGRFEQLDDKKLITTAERVRFGKIRNGEKFDHNIYVQYDRASVRGPGSVTSTAADIGDGSALSVNYVWTGRYFDSLPYPTRGYGLGAEVGGGYTTSQPFQPFLRLQGRGLGIVPLPGTFGRLALRGEVAAIEGANDARIPGTLLFKTGGDTSVRGYAFRTIGLDRANGVVAPGRYLAVASVELQRPYLSNGQPTAFENTFFVDMGDVANKPNDLRPKIGVGTGVRVRTPIGPLTAAVAYGLDSRKFRLHLTVGFTF